MINYLKNALRKAGDERLFYIAEALKRGITIETIHQWSKIDLFYLKENGRDYCAGTKLAAQSL